MRPRRNSAFEKLSENPANARPLRRRHSALEIVRIAQGLDFDDPTFAGRGFKEKIDFNSEVFLIGTQAPKSRRLELTANQGLFFAAQR